MRGRCPLGDQHRQWVRVGRQADMHHDRSPFVLLFHALSLLAIAMDTPLIPPGATRVPGAAPAMLGKA